MPNLLIRCSLPDALAADEFREWLDVRRRGLAHDPAVDDVEAGPIGPAAWVLELEVGDGGEGSVAALLGDLRLLGLDPVVFRPAGVASRAPEHAGARPLRG